MDPVIQLIAADIPRTQMLSELPVVKDVHWSIERGQFWIVGAQPGAGKTDLLSTAAGLLRPIRGEHRLFGKSTDQMSEEELVEMRLRIAMVFSTGRLFNGLTVAQNIALPLTYHRTLNTEELTEAVSKTLDKTGLTFWENKHPDQITRNLHQRVGLARAMALNPEVFLIDNPLAAIDPRQSRWWLDFLCEIQKTATLIVTVDDFRPWLDVGTRFAVLKERHFVVIGGRDEIRNSQDALVRELLTSAFDSI